MNHKDWINKLDDKEIQRLLSKKPKYKEIPYFLDNKLINIIRDKEKITYERKKFYLIKFSKYAFSLSVLLILLFFSYFYFIRNILISNYNKCFIVKINGNAFIRDNFGMTKEIEKIPYNVKESYLISVKENSNLELTVGDNSIVQLNQLSELKIVKIFKEKEIERTNLYVNLGNINFKPKLINRDSIFEVDTDLIIIKVSGTDFTVNVDNNRNINVFIKEGSVLIKPKINIIDLDKIKKIDLNFSEKLKNILLSEIQLNKDESIDISYSNFKDIESQILEIINILYEKFNKNRKSKEKIKEIIEQSRESIDKIINLKNKLFILKNESEVLNNIIDKEKRFIFTKLSLSPKINLTEKNSCVTNDNDNIYISSDSNNAIFAINIFNGKLKWKFSDVELKDITTPIIPFNNKLVLGSSNYIYILDKNGKVILKEKLNNGLTYWAKSIIAKNKLFIPTSQYLYFYDGEKIDIIKEFPKASGQLYISYYNDKLFCLDSNELNIKIFDLTNNKIIWTSLKLNNRAFIEPEIKDNIIYIADIKNNLYKFNYEINKEPEIISIGTGILTNLIFNDKKINFIGIDGFFYELKNNIQEKIIKVDNNPDIDKYLTKKIIKYNNYILFCSDTGNVFYYNMINGEKKLLDIPQNDKKLPLIGSPVILNNNIYIIDIESNIYKVSINL